MGVHENKCNKYTCTKSVPGEAEDFLEC